MPRSNPVIKYRPNTPDPRCTNGTVADTLVVYAKTKPEEGAHGITAFVVEKGMPVWPPENPEPCMMNLGAWLVANVAVVGYWGVGLKRQPLESGHAAGLPRCLGPSCRQDGVT